jgi:beta-lactamase regulating signal transducer with metallopeptidase domain/predicted  nucleic acid-binding Zn-ribbon protein
MPALLLLRASVLLGLGVVTARLLRRAPAVTSHQLWSTTFAAVLLMPLLAATLPGVPVRMPARWRSTPLAAPRTTAWQPAPAFPANDPPRDVAIATGAGPEAAARPDPSARSVARGQIDPGWTLTALLLAVWLAGTALAAGSVVVSLLRVRRLARAAEDLGDPSWHRAAAALAPRLGLRRPARLRISAGVTTPMAGGIFRHNIFLPAAARGWSAERRDLVLAHEIAHLAGRDPLRHLIARLALACYWFHPLAWIAARQSAIARERACDEAVLGLGTRPSAYARVLVELADSMQASAAVRGALPIVERSLLETRVMAILNDDVRPVRRRFNVPAIGAALIALAIAAVQPVVRASPTAAPSEMIGHTDAAAAVPLPASSARLPIADAARGFDASGRAAQSSRDSACSWNALDDRSFHGSMSTSRSSGGTIVYEQIGARGSDRLIQKTFGDTTVCMLAEEVGDRYDSEPPSRWIGRAARVVLETHHGTATERLEIADRGGLHQVKWEVGGRDHVVDAAAQQWRDRLFAVLDTTWDLSMLHGQVSSLRGEISSIHGQRSSLNGEISSLRGQVSSMHGEISSVRGQESSLRGQISSIEGHVTSLRGAISSESGAISSLNANRYGADASERSRIAGRIAGHDAEIARLEKDIVAYNADARIAAVEKEIAALDVEGKVAAIEKQIRDFDLEGRVKAIERQIADLDVDGKVAGIEKQIAGLDVDRRSHELEGRLDGQLKDLEAAIRAIR